MKIKKLNTRGFSHDLILVAFLLVFAIVGVAMLVGSHAASNPNPNNCTIKPGVTNPTANQPSQIYGYYNNGVNGQSWKSHLYTLTRNDGGYAFFGYCWSSGEGMAYSTPVKVQGVQTVPVYQYFSDTIFKDFYTTAQPSVEPNCCGYKINKSYPVAFYVFPVQVDGTVPLLRFYNPSTKSHVYTIDSSPHTASVLASNFGYTNREGSLGFVWPNGTTANGKTINGSTSTTVTGNVGTPTTQVAVKPATPAPTSPNTLPPSGGSSPVVTTPKTGGSGSGGTTTKPKTTPSTTTPALPTTPKTKVPVPPAKSPTGVCKLPVVKNVWKTCTPFPDPVAVTQPPKGVVGAVNDTPYYTVYGKSVFTTQGGKLYVPYGISVVDSLDQEPDWNNKNFQAATNAQIQAAAKYWHSNTIRIQVSEKVILENKDAMSQLLDQIDEMESLGVVPVISNNLQRSDPNENAPTQRTVTFWKTLMSRLEERSATKYRNVVFDLFNEPFHRDTSGKIHWDQWKNGGTITQTDTDKNGKKSSKQHAYLGMQQVVNAIRNSSSSLKDNLIWVESEKTSDGWRYLDQLLLNGSNIVYSYHHIQLDKRNLWADEIGLTTQQKHAVPIVDGEWAQYDSHRPECYPVGATVTDDYLSLLHDNQIGLVFWSLEPGVGTSLNAVQGNQTRKLLNDRVDSQFPTTASGYSQPNRFPSNPANYKCSDTNIDGKVVFYQDRTVDNNGDNDNGSNHYLNTGYGAGSQVMNYFNQYSGN